MILLADGVISALRIPAARRCLFLIYLPQPVIARWSRTRLGVGIQQGPNSQTE